MAVKFLILGGTGRCGRLIARHLLERSDACVTIASRRLEKAEAFAEDLARHWPGRVFAAQAQPGDDAALVAALTGHNMVVLAAPTPGLAGKVARTALAAGVDYLDTPFSARKLAVLKAMAGEIEAAGRCFITEAGLHPGLPSALVRYAAAHLDRLETAAVGSYLGLNQIQPYTDAVDEIVEIIRTYRAQIYDDGQWSDPGTFQMKRIEFGGDIGSHECYPVLMEELRALPQMQPTVTGLAFYFSQSHWVTDRIVSPLAMAMLKFVPGARRTAGRFLWWGMMRFRKAPYRTEMVVRASGKQAGQDTTFEAAVSHRDIYELTAMAVTAALLQYMEGMARRPGLSLMGQIVEPRRLFTDMKRMGAKLRTTTS